MFSLLRLRILYFPYYIEVSLDIKLEGIFQNNSINNNNSNNNNINNNANNNNNKIRSLEDF